MTQFQLDLLLVSQLGKTEKHRQEPEINSIFFLTIWKAKFTERLIVWNFYGRTLMLPVKNSAGLVCFLVAFNTLIMYFDPQMAYILAISLLIVLKSN